MPPEKGAKVRLGSPLGIVDHAGAICTFVQCYPDHAKLIFYLFSKASPLIDQRLLLLGRRLKDINQRDQIPLFGNKHLFSPLMSCSIDGAGHERRKEMLVSKEGNLGTLIDR